MSTSAFFAQALKQDVRDFVFFVLSLTPTKDTQRKAYVCESLQKLSFTQDSSSLIGSKNDFIFTIFQLFGTHLVIIGKQRGVLLCVLLGLGRWEGI